MTAPTRPTVTVVMPFAGDREAGNAALTALAGVELGPGDEAFLVDNTLGQVLAEVASLPPGVSVVPAPERPSAYHARNAGAARAKTPWLLFIDADCVPDPGLVDAYFARPPGDRVGAVAGLVEGDPGQRGLVARWAVWRRALDQAAIVAGTETRPFAVTANVLVRTRAWRDVGGFAEAVRSGGDADFSWRLQDAGWELDFRAKARVVHRHREDLRSLLRVTARYAAGRAWLQRRHGAAFTRPRASTQVPRALAAAARWLLSGRSERAAFRAIDAMVLVADVVGTRLSNASRPPRVAPGGDLVVMADRFPVLTETFIAAEVRALLALGHRVRVEAGGRADRQDLVAARDLPVTYSEDDSAARKARDLAWLLTRHPLRCAADAAARRRWREQEPVVPLRALAPLARRLASGGERRVHAHFAMGAALGALRLSRIMGLRFSLTAHAYDIYLTPVNLDEKLRAAEVVTSGCDYTVRDLRALAGPEHADRVHKIVMGVEGSEFVRRVPYPGTRVVLGVGRLVQKKGFGDLIEAAGLLADAAPIDDLVLIGDGPLRERLAAQAQRLGVADTVRFLGSQPHEAIRDELERADLLAMPCVVAQNGDRDSMPVVVKEALAMEIPVVATEEVGLPELVRPAWGRLVAPHDPRALADAIAELLALPAAERAAMGAAGRAFVLEHCNVERETAKLAALLGLAGTAR